MRPGCASSIPDQTRDFGRVPAPGFIELAPDPVKGSPPNSGPMAGVATCPGRGRACGPRRALYYSAGLTEWLSDRGAGIIRTLQRRAENAGHVPRALVRLQLTCGNTAAASSRCTGGNGAIQ
jgi:hypothetical protein